MTFGEKLKSLRKQSKLSQSELADKLLLTRQVVSKWERGNGLPDIDNLKKISQFFKVSIDEMLDYKIEEINLKLEEEIEKLDKKDISNFKKIRAFVLDRFSQADEIYELSQEINLNIWQEIIYSLLDFDVVLGLHDLIQNGIVYSFYLKKDDVFYLALIKKSTLLTKRVGEFKKRHLIVDGYRYEKVKKLK